MIRDMITWRINRTLPLILTYLFIFLRCARFELEAPAFLGGLFFCGLTLLLLIYVTPIKKNHNILIKILLKSDKCNDYQFFSAFI